MNIIYYVTILTLTMSLNGCASTHHKPPAAEVQDIVYRPVSLPAAVQTPVATSFTWPVKGSVISAFGDRSDDIRNKGIDIAAAEGSVVRAAGEGRVVYCDSMMRGFGKTVILDHGNAVQTVYSYNSEILVKIGDTVKKSDPIAKVGSTGRARTPSLHFEIRKDGEPMNPMAYLH